MRLEGNGLDALLRYSSITAGALIVIEGADGSGKALQTELLLKNLESARAQGRFQVNIGSLDFPQYGKTRYADVIGRFQNGEFGDPTGLSPYLIILMYALDRFSEKKQLLRFKERGNIGVLNRYITANLGHQAGRMRTEKEQWECTSFIEETEYGLLGLPRPDLVFYLDIPKEISRVLMMLKKERKYTLRRDLVEESDDYQDKAICFFRQLCERRSSRTGKVECWRRIECSRQKELDTLDTNALKKLEDILLSDPSKKAEAFVRQEISEKFLFSPEEIQSMIIKGIGEHFSQL